MGSITAKNDLACTAPAPLLTALVRGARAKTLAAPGLRPRHADGGDALGRAIVAAGSSVAAVARALGIDESVVREIRDGKLPLTDEKVRALPATVRRAYLTAQLADMDEESPVSRAPLEVQALGVGRAVGDLHADVLEAAADGIFDARELDRIENRAMSVETTARIVRISAARARRSGT